jgi:hypothetical protein
MQIKLIIAMKTEPKEGLKPALLAFSIVKRRSPFKNTLEHMFSIHLRTLSNVILIPQYSTRISLCLNTSFHNYFQIIQEKHLAHSEIVWSHSKISKYYAQEL